MNMNAYIERTLSKVIKNATDTFPAVLVTGPRQVGKTTVLERLKEPERTYVSLDDPQVRALAKEDPHLFLQTWKTPLFIDEIQYAPEIFPHIKMKVDKEKQKGMFWITGSQQFQLMKNVSESLAGRVAILELQGFSQAERQQRQVQPFLPGNPLPGDWQPADVHQVYETILTGSFPGLWTIPEMQRHIFYASYLKTYLERDIRGLVNVSDEHSFLRFLRVAAARTAQLLNYSDMARDVDLSVNTVKSWVSILETSGLIYLLQPWHNSVSQRAIKTPKLYFVDTGLCSFLSGWETVATLSNGAMSGAILETHVVSEILKSYWHNGQRPAVFFYRDRDRREIDLLIEHDGLLHPVEIKRTASPKTADVKNFDILRRSGLPVGKGAIVCLYDKPFPLNSDTDIIPVSSL
jgi:predicted AAA+ superfamily ATPase